jgi:hypothetical protein
MLFPQYELLAVDDGAICAEHRSDAIGGSAACGKPATVSCQYLPHGKAQNLCAFHFGQILSNSQLEHQILIALLSKALKEEPTGKT